MQFFFMRTKLEDEFDQGYEEKGFSIVMNKFFNNMIHPHPISEYDVIDSNGFILEQFKDISDNQLLQLMDDELHGSDDKFHGSDGKCHGSDDKLHVLYDKFHGSDDKFHGLDEKFHGLDDKFHGSDDKLHGLDDKFYGSDDDTEKMTILCSVLALRAGKGVAELLVDPEPHGWRRALRISSRIKGNIKPEILSRYDEQQGIIYDSSRLGMEFQFKTQDLDQVEMDYVDKHEIIKPVPGLGSLGLRRSPGQMGSPVLMRSPVLRSPGLTRSPVLMRSPGLRSPGLRSPGVLRSPGLRSPGILRSHGLMRVPGLMRFFILRSPVLMRAPGVLRSPGLRSHGRMGSPTLMRSPGLMRSPVLMRSPDVLMRSHGLMRSLVLRSPGLM